MGLNKLKKISSQTHCIRCNSVFKSNPMIQGDNICQTCNSMNCITFWFPRISNLGFPVPKTKIIHANFNLLQCWHGVCDKKPENANKFLTEIKEAIKEVGLPAFLRTGYLSNKHDWKNSCFISDKFEMEHLYSHICNIIEMSCMAMPDRVIPIDFWAVREMIETDPYFVYFSGMPITKERRFFVRDGKIECHHNYWDRKAFGKDISDKVFKNLSSLSVEDEKQLTEMALYLGQLFSGYWSLDFLKSKKGDWYLTDMAIGENSFHSKCEKNKLIKIG
jgi:hypothetical protein